MSHQLEGDRLDFSQLPQRIAKPSRAESMARTKPATFTALDILSLRGIALGDEQLRIRRRRLESLVPNLVPPVQDTPATRDHEVAQNWLRDYADAAVGVEGLLWPGFEADHLTA